jgi:hypothetical protein
MAEMKTYSKILVRFEKKKMEWPAGGIVLIVTSMRTELSLGTKNLMTKVIVLQVCKAVILMILEKERCGIGSLMRIWLENSSHVCH